MNSVISVLTMLFSAFLSSVSQILLKKSAKSKHKNIIFEYINPNVLISYAILLLTMFLNILAYRHIEYKLGPILTSTSYLFVLIMSRIILKESLTKNKIIGMLLIFMGIVIFNFG